MSAPTPRPALKATGMRRRHARCLETELAAITAERDQLRAEVERLKPYVLKAILTTEGTMLCSSQVAVKYNAAIARAERAEADAAAERTRLDSGQILLTVSGERVWHCGVDLRAAIDAGMREGAK